MTTILTAPERIRMMLRDADARIKEAFDTFPNDIDTSNRPAWYISAEDGTYPPTAAGVETPEERYQLVLVHHAFGSGGLTNRDIEIECREIVANTVVYFAQRQQLQFSNLLSLEQKPLFGLDGVKWARIASRTKVGPRTREGAEGTYWGCELVMTVMSEFAYQQVIVART